MCCGRGARLGILYARGRRRGRRPGFWVRGGEWGGGGKGCMYVVVEGEVDAVEIGVGSVEEVVDGECVCFVDGFGVGEGLQHGPDDDVWVDDC